MHALSDSLRHLYNTLYRDLGDDLIQFLQDKEVNEVMVNQETKGEIHDDGIVLKPSRSQVSRNNNEEKMA